MKNMRQPQSVRPIVRKRVPRTRTLQTPADIQAWIDQMKKRYAKYLLPIEEVRRTLDEEMGDHTLTEELFRMRGK